jgi:hypothetical protein
VDSYISSRSPKNGFRHSSRWSGHQRTHSAGLDQSSNRSCQSSGQQSPHFWESHRSSSGQQRMHLAGLVGHHPVNRECILAGLAGHHPVNRECILAGLAGHHPVNRESILWVSLVISQPVTSELLVPRHRPLGWVQLDELGGRMCSKGAFTGIMDIKTIGSGLVREMIES